MEDKMKMMKQLKSKFLPVTMAMASILWMAAATAQAATLSISDGVIINRLDPSALEVVVGDESDVGVLARAPLPLEGPYWARGNSTGVYPDQYATEAFIRWDVSSLSAGDVGAPGFTATLTVTLYERLNTANSASLYVDTFSTVWDAQTATGSILLPTYTAVPTLGASSTEDRVCEDIKDTVTFPGEPNAADRDLSGPPTREVDVTSFVSDWVTTGDNTGFVFWIAHATNSGGRTSNGIGFDVSLEILGGGSSTPGTLIYGK